MKLPVSFAVAFALAATLALGQAQTKRYLYASTPDASQEDGRSGNGILIFDIDNGHKLVRRIDIPIFKEGIRGFTGNLKTHCVYYSTSNRRLGCFDLETEKVVWEKTYEAGVTDRRSRKMGRRSMFPPGGGTPARIAAFW